MYICKMSYSSAMKKRYQLLKRVSIILIFFVLFTKMHAVEPQYAEPQDIQKTETNVEVEEHPQDYIVIKIPFQAKYKPLFICIIVLALSSICFFIIICKCYIIEIDNHITISFHGSISYDA